jgi:uncharacterized protein (TIGR02466 family)
VRNLFPTPVAILAVPDAARINAALEARILEREAGTESLRHSNWGGWQSPWDFADWCGPEGEAVLGMAQNLARNLTGDRQGRPQDLRWRMNAWANVNRQGQGNEFHTHPGAYWSATYYVRDGQSGGGAGDNPDVGGEFEIQDPRGIAPAMLAPMLAFRTAGGQSVGANEIIAPRAGNLVMFPSWLSHGVRPYHGQDVRISIALNLTPV